MTSRSLTIAILIAAVLGKEGSAQSSLQVPPPGAGAYVPECDARRQSDVDADGLSDACEIALARAFAPELLADPSDCSWIEANGSRRLGGGYFYVVAPLGAMLREVRIAYMPAYFKDCGWTGIQRVLRLGRSDAHAGDSELIVLDVARDSAEKWRSTGVFLSAHCSGLSDGRCRWYRRDELAAFNWVNAHEGGAPQVWVSRAKHANYPSRAACESGHWLQDSCASTPAAYRFPLVSPSQNIGSRSSPGFSGGCVLAEQLPLGGAGVEIRGPVRGGAHRAAVRVTDQLPVECLFDRERRFTGWQDGPIGSASPYGRILERFAGL